MLIMKCANCGQDHKDPNCNKFICSFCNFTNNSDKYSHEHSEVIQTKKQFNLNNVWLKRPVYYWLGIAGCIILFLGVFSPIYNFPLYGTISSFNKGNGFGIYLLLAIIPVLFVKNRHSREILNHLAH